MPLVRYLENFRQNDQEILNKGGWGRAKRAPSDRTLSAGGSLRSIPATHFRKPFRFRLGRVREREATFAYRSINIRISGGRQGDEFSDTIRFNGFCLPI